jgi:hypothetical protein
MVIFNSSAQGKREGILLQIPASRRWRIDTAGRTGTVSAGRAVVSEGIGSGAAAIGYFQRVKFQFLKERVKFEIDRHSPLGQHRPGSD